MEFHRSNLDNGIRTIIAPMPTASTVALQVWFSCGSRVEDDHEAGLAHVNEHMFFKGGRDFPDSKSVNRELWLLGDNYNAFTAREYVVYFIVTGAQFFERAVHILSDMLIHARFDAEDFETERGAILRELERTPDDAEEFSFQEFVKLFFGNHPLGRTNQDQIMPVRSFSVGDVHSFKERFYGPPNMVISVAGGVDVVQAKDFIKRYFGVITEKEKVAWKEFIPCPPVAPTRLIKRDALSHAYLHIGSPALSYFSTDTAVLAALSEILNQRLWISVRDERGLAYDIGSSAKSFSDNGMLSVSTSISSETETVEEVLGLIFKEMRSIRDGDITEEECSDTKIALHSRTDLALASPANVGWFFGSNELLRQKVEDISDVHREIEGVTRDRIIRLGQKLWQEKMVRALLFTTDFPRFEEAYLKMRSVLR